MTPHDYPLFFGKWAWLEQYAVRHTQFANVMEQCALRRNNVEEFQPVPIVRKRGAMENLKHSFNTTFCNKRLSIVGDGSLTRQKAGTDECVTCFTQIRDTQGTPLQSGESGSPFSKTQLRMPDRIGAETTPGNIFKRLHAIMDGLFQTSS